MTALAMSTSGLLLSTNALLSSSDSRLTHSSPSEVSQHTSHAPLRAVRSKTVAGRDKRPNNDRVKAEVSSVIIPPGFEVYNSKAWSKLSVQELQEVRFEWKKENNPLLVARTIAGRISPWFNVAETQEAMFLQDIEKSISTFHDLCTSRLENVSGYRIKVTAMRGKSATRCPAWHTDYVPMRWIQTFYGPGCCYVDPDATKNNVIIQRVMDPQGGLVKPAAWKERQIAKSGVTVCQAALGEPVVLVGHRWSETKKAHLDDLSGVLHRSPLNVPSSQGRVLLTLDVVIDEEESSCDCCH